MYSTCLFCNRPLGRNEALEHFAVGRRLAYDPAKGRLWVVCGRCERWNLSPLETRWEAIEDAERAYRGAALRLATDNVGLAQLPEGLDLVRLGPASRPEFAAWRYGDQFGRRRRRHIAFGVTAAVGMLAPGVAPVFGLAAGVGLLGTGIGLAFQATALVRGRSAATRVKLIVRDRTDTPLLLTYSNVRCAALVPSHDGLSWHLKLPHRNPPAGAAPRELGITAMVSPQGHETLLTGSTAQRALATMLPHLNRNGASQSQVRTATDVVAASTSLQHLLRLASVNDEAKRTHFKIKDGESNVGALPPRLRLALEMALHEDDERRAMEGELQELEERWREADAIASIADALLVPTEIEDALAVLARRRRNVGA